MIAARERALQDYKDKNEARLKEQEEARIQAEDNREREAAERRAREAAAIDKSRKQQVRNISIFLALKGMISNRSDQECKVRMADSLNGVKQWRSIKTGHSA